MTDRERIAGLAEQIELARKYLDEWPQWSRSNAHFAGSNDVEDLSVPAGQTAESDQVQTASHET